MGVHSSFFPSFFRCFFALIFFFVFVAFDEKEVQNGNKTSKNKKCDKKYIVRKKIFAHKLKLRAAVLLAFFSLSYLSARLAGDGASIHGTGLPQ